MPKYKDDEGNYLVVVNDPQEDRYFIAWWLHDEGDVGSRLGTHYSHTEPPKHSEAWISWAADKAALPHATYATTNGFIFCSRRAACKALEAVNIALTTGDVWPDWARRAHQAGWAPPPDWRP